MAVMCSKQRPYLSYLLRMWQVQEANGLVWRASLVNPHTGEQHFFASTDRLYKFLISGGTDSSAVSGATGTQTDHVEEG